MLVMMRLYLRHKNVSHTPQNHDETQGVVPSVCSNTPRTRTTYLLEVQSKANQTTSKKKKGNYMQEIFQL
jgi:hypothetical protein